MTFWNCLTRFGGCSWCHKVSGTLPLGVSPPPPPHPATPKRAAPARPAPPILKKSRRLIPPSTRASATLPLTTFSLLSGTRRLVRRRLLPEFLQDPFGLDGDPFEVGQPQTGGLAHPDVPPT